MKSQFPSQPASKFLTQPIQVLRLGTKTGSLMSNYVLLHSHKLLMHLGAIL